MRKILIGFIILAITISILVVGIAVTSRAQDEGSKTEVLEKLDEVLKNQKEILEGIASIKEELNVIKIRVTR